MRVYLTSTVNTFCSVNHFLSMIRGMFGFFCTMFAGIVAVYLLKSILICLNLFCERNFVGQDVQLLYFLCCSL